MGGRGSSSHRGDGAEEYYGPVDPRATDFITDDDMDSTEAEDYLRRFAGWLGELGDDIDHYFTDPIDPNSPAGRYFRVHSNFTHWLPDGVIGSPLS